MSAVWLWVRADLRRRWRSWVVLGLLAGVSVGLAAAGVAGARRTERTVPHYVRAAHIPDAAVLANNPNYGPKLRREVAALPHVRDTYPFMVPFFLEVGKPYRFDAPLVPIGAPSARTFAGIILDGRPTNPARPDEIVVNENVRDRFGLGIGKSFTLRQPAQPDGTPAFSQRMRVVGISDATDNELDSTPSAGFYAAHRHQLIGFVNEFADLDRPSDFVGFQLGVQRVVGLPVNVASSGDIFGLTKLRDVSNIEQSGLLLFALAVIIGAGVLVGQALVRAVSAGAADLPTWRSIGADRSIVVRSLVAPTIVTVVVGGVTSFLVAVALSPRFPIAITRRYELDRGFHVDWTVLLGATAFLAVAVLGTAWITAELRVRRRDREQARASGLGRLVTSASLPPPLVVGSRLAVEPGRGRRAVPVRSALVGAIVGVLGVVGCLTFRAGLSETVADPSRSGITWDLFAATAGPVPRAVTATAARDPRIAGAVDAVWARSISVDGRPTPIFGTKPVKGNLDFVVLQGRTPDAADEIAFATSTMRALHAHVGQIVRVGPRQRPLRVVGEVLVPATSHTDYDESGMTNLATLQPMLPPASKVGDDFVEDYVLVRLHQGASRPAVLASLKQAAGSAGESFVEPAVLPSAIVSLGELRSLPFSLAIFFGLLAVATVAHALVTTIRRRRHDLAVLRSIGFTRRDTRIAIAWQSTVIALVGVVVGVPLGIIAGRAVWKQLAESFPVAYTPPLALVAMLLVVPVAIGLANLVAAAPAYAATRIRPATALRTE